MKLRLACCLAFWVRAMSAFWLLGSGVAWATVKSEKVQTSRSAQAEYAKAFAYYVTLARRNELRLASSVPFFQKNWVEKSAYLNVLCVQSDPESCLEGLSWGLEDRALVVRDQAFRLLLALPFVEEQRRMDAALKITADERNFRRGLPLWIIDTAREFLASR
jgi:hypothetical protein